MILVYYFVLYFGIGIFGSYLTLFFLKHTPLTETQITLVLSFKPFINILSANFFAYVSDRFNKHKLMLFFGFITTIITSFILLYLSVSQDIRIIIFAYFLLSFFISYPPELSDNFALEYGNIHNLPFGRIRLFGSLGYAIAGFIGGRLTGYYGLTIIFYAYGLSLLVPALMVFKLPNISTKEDTKPKAEKIYQRLFQIKEFRYILVLSFLMFGSINAMSTFFSIYIQNYAKLDLAFLGLTMFITASAEIPMMFMSDRLINKYGAYKILSMASFLTFIRFMVYFFLPSKPWIILVSFTHGIGYGGAFTALMHLIKEHIPSDIRASAIGFNSSVAMGLGSFLIVSISSFLFNAHSVFLILSVFQFIAAIFTFRLSQN